MTDERHQDDEHDRGPEGGPHAPEAERPALFPTEGLAPGEDVAGGRLADLGTDPSQPPEAIEDLER